MKYATNVKIRDEINFMLDTINKVSRKRDALNACHTKSIKSKNFHN